MRFLLLLTEKDHYGRWDALTEAERAEAMDAFRTFVKAVQERGEVVDGDALHPPQLTRTVQSGAARTVTYGPFAETVEQLGGYYVIDVPDMATAVELARLLPSLTAVEVRQTRGVQIR
jgi:hypothetical protein